MMEKTNVVVIFIDDMGYRDLACTGSDFYETPNIDRLAADGMRFDNGYASCPVCSPSRASLMTGKYPARIGITDWIDHSGTFHPLKGRLIEAPYIKSLPIKEQGYDTWHVGKWHLGTDDAYPDRVGFDVNIGGCDWGHPKKGYFSPYHIKTLSEGPDGEFLSDRLTDEAINLVNNSNDAPFYLNMWHYAVHTPIQAKQKDIRYFEEKAKRMGLDNQNPFVEGEPFSTDDKKGARIIRRVIQSDPCYAALIYNLDENVGRLIDAIDKKGKLENTLIIFTSDNGGLSTAEGSPTCNLPLSEGKGWTKEGGLRVPVIAYHKGKITAGSCCNVPVTTPDIFSTILDVAGVEIADPTVDGRSIADCFKGGEIEYERPIYWHYPHYGNQGGTPGAAVRCGDFKLIQYFEDERYELYNLKNDYSEKDNLIYKMPEKVSELSKMLSSWQEDVCAVFPQKV